MGEFFSGGTASVAAMEAALALGAGWGGDTRLWLAVEEAMRERTSDPGQCRPII